MIFLKSLNNRLRIQQQSFKQFVFLVLANKCDKSAKHRGYPDNCNIGRELFVLFPQHPPLSDRQDNFRFLAVEYSNAMTFF